MIKKILVSLCIFSLSLTFSGLEAYDMGYDPSSEYESASYDYDEYYDAPGDFEESSFEEDPSYGMEASSYEQSYDMESSDVESSSTQDPASISPDSSYMVETEPEYMVEPEPDPESYEMQSSDLNSYEQESADLYDYEESMMMPDPVPSINPTFVNPSPTTSPSPSPTTSSSSKTTTNTSTSSTTSSSAASSVTSSSASSSTSTSSSTSSTKSGSTYADPRSKVSYEAKLKIDRQPNVPVSVTRETVWRVLEETMDTYLQDMEYCGHDQNHEYTSPDFPEEWMIHASSHMSTRKRGLCKANLYVMYYGSGESSHDDLYAEMDHVEYNLDYYMDLTKDEVVSKKREARVGFTEVIEKYDEDGTRANLNINSECEVEKEKYDPDNFKWRRASLDHEEVGRQVTEKMVEIKMPGMEDSTTPVPEQKYEVSVYIKDKDHVPDVTHHQLVNASLFYPADYEKPVEFDIDPYQWFEQDYEPGEHNRKVIRDYADYDFEYMTAHYGASHFVLDSHCSHGFKTSLNKDLDTLK